jgi:hypothetical protein
MQIENFDDEDQPDLEKALAASPELNAFTTL